MTQDSDRQSGGHDPGDSVPPGVAPVNPVPLTDEERKVKQKLEELGGGKPVEHGPQGQAETDGPERPGR